MELNYNLNEPDYLHFQMYYASKNETITKQRRLSRTLVLVVCALIGILFFLERNMFVGWYFVIAGFICYIFFPKYLNWFYKRIFRKNIARTYKDIVPVHIWLRFDDEKVVILDRGRTTSFSIDKIEEIIELKDYFYLRMSAIEYVLIPKEELNNEDDIRLYLQGLAGKFSLTYSLELDWKWK